ncbi:hypothetical protein BpHYR1_030688 [Brachionus plicatilis]|uniref:Uncharacterized protein n=1 Tax=Brachionus plicatilis TaxID=10195 RepID=A0A3M7PZ35_BRAPC|nr:hypothetical protein BpHYR1_030688 [Brachionus plicatilis]
MQKSNFINFTQIMLENLKGKLDLDTYGKKKKSFVIEKKLLRIQKDVLKNEVKQLKAYSVRT